HSPFDHLHLHSFPHDALPIFFYLASGLLFEDAPAFMLRSIFVIAIIVCGMAAAVVNRFAGLILYIWFALFRPQEWVSPANRFTTDRKSTRLNSSHVAISYAVF